MLGLTQAGNVIVQFTELQAEGAAKLHTGTELRHHQLSVKDELPWMDNITMTPVMNS